MLGNNSLLWENDDFIVCTPFNPHVSYSEGPVVVVKTKRDIKTSWQEPRVTGRAFELAVRVCAVMEELHLAPWFNVQANGNWGLLPDARPFFHIYIYGRNRTARWAKPIILPEAPLTYKHDPMPERDQQLLRDALGVSLRGLQDASYPWR